MENLKIFENAEFGQIRTVQLNNGTYFVGKDVAEALGYSNVRNAVPNHVAVEDRLCTRIEYAGQKREVTVINESGLYALIFGSKLESAKRFKHWVTSEVLPTIRKHGAYMTPEKIEEVLLNPDTIISLAQELKDERALRNRLQDKIDADRPKTIFADAVTASETAILVRELAKLLKQNGIDTGERRLYSWLRENGYLIKKRGDDYNLPTQKSMEMGLFKVKKTAITHSSGFVTVNTTTVVTGKGQQYFIDKFLNSAQLMA